MLYTQTFEPVQVIRSATVALCRHITFWQSALVRAAAAIIRHHDRMASICAVTRVDQAYNLTCYKKSFQCPLVVNALTSASCPALLPNAFDILLSAAEDETTRASTTKALQAWMKLLTRDSCDVLVVQLPPSPAGTATADQSLTDAAVVALLSYAGGEERGGSRSSAVQGTLPPSNGDTDLVRAIRSCIQPLVQGELLPGTRFKEVYLLSHTLCRAMADHYPALCCAPPPRGMHGGPRALPALPWCVPLPAHVSPCDPRVTPTTVLGPVYLSAWEQASDGQALVQAGIGAVLNCATLAECPNTYQETGLPPATYHWLSGESSSVLQGVQAAAAQHTPVTYLCLGLEDEPGQELQEAITTAVAFIRRHRRAGLGRGVLIHCAQGLSRSVSILLAYLMMDYGLGYRHAREVVEGYRQHGSRASPNAGFRRQLMALDGMREDGGSSGYAKAELYPLASPVGSPKAAHTQGGREEVQLEQLPALPPALSSNAPLARTGSKSLLQACSPSSHR